MYRHAKIFVLVFSILALLCGVAHAQPGVRFVDEGNDAGTFPITAHISRVEFTPRGLNIDFDKKATWPDVTPAGWDGPIRYAIGLVLKVDGEWVAGGYIEYWADRDDTGTGPLQNLTDPVCPGGAGQIHCNWFYNEGRWPTLYRAVLHAGDALGVFVVSGSPRNHAYKIQERSDIAWVTLPNAGEGHTFLFGTPTPTPTPDPVPVPPPADETLSMRVDRIDNEVGVLTIALDQLRQAYEALKAFTSGVASQAAAAEASTQRIDGVLASRPLFSGCQASVFGLSIHCALVP
jgi:hypothetical protein